jgi:hypothetical protein
MPPPKPPTIAQLMAQGVTGFAITCNSRSCAHSTYLSFDGVGVGDAEEFPSIAGRRRFVCSKCGGRSVHVMPDWRTHRVSGVGVMAGGTRRSVTKER